jgi:3-carboxy-cis,cis-muconate cycloisomerase
MPASPADSQIYRRLFADDETAQLFTDSAEIRAMLLVEGTLAKVQGDLGLIPQDAAHYLHRCAFELQIDPAALTDETTRSGVPVPALLAAMRKAGAGDQMHHLHWGATSQDIIDTALALRLKRLTALWDARLATLTATLGTLAKVHADTPMLARTYGQAATATSFGAVVASWGSPLLRHRRRLAQLLPDLLTVSLSGAAGTLSAMGPKGPQVRAALAQSLALHDPLESRHSQRDSIAAFGAWMAGLAASLGKLGEDLLLMTQTGISEVTLATTGGSSTMPQKANPIGPSVLVALSRQITGLSAILTGAGLHRQQRDGAAWFTEWLTLPQMCILTGRALSLAQETAAGLTPDPARMAANLAATRGLHRAEALSFALSAHMPRPEAQAAAKALAARALAENRDLIDLARAEHPRLDLPGEDLGAAPDEARAFAAQAALA